MTAPAGTPPVVVGVDGSADAGAAARLAAEEALRRHAPLDLVLAFPWPEGATVPAPEGFDGRAAMHVMAELALETTADELRRHHPGVTVRSSLVVGPAPEVLLAAARSAQLLCVGSRSSNAVEDVLLGSTAAAVARAAPCPVLVVPLRAGAPHRARAGVAVGVVDENDAVVLEAAFRAAADRECEVVVVHTWRHPVPGPMHVVLDPLVGTETAQRREEDELADLLVPCTTRHPQVPVRPVVERGRPAEVLLAAALSAELVVVGRHARAGGVLGALRSTTNAVLHRAGCPVQVVPVGAPA